MATDDLNTPLGQARPASRFAKLPKVQPPILAGLLATTALIVVAWAIIVDNPLGGEPMAVVATGQPNASNAETAKGDGREHSRRDGPDAVARIPEPAKLPDGAKTVTIIDGSSGKRQEVVISGNGVPDSADKAMAKAIDSKAPETKAGSKTEPKPETKSETKPEIKSETDSNSLNEKSRYGFIPKVGANGVKPVVAFAQTKNLPATLKDRPRIAVVLTGMGISASGTADAFTLPQSVTFALAPYAVDVARLADRARDEGHELLLQAPMEPFDYPDNDPGPQTLLTSLTPEQNIERLYWLMSRMQGYVGIMSYMGARFLSAEAALAPVISETAKRGLLFVDGSASSRSLAGQLTTVRNVPFAKTDIVIDAVPTPVEIDRALARLEIAARDGGSAVGIATAQPGTITRIAEWMAKVEGRGFVLVPISMAVGKSKST